jgi:hypothetical protein
MSNVLENTPSAVQLRAMLEEMVGSDLLGPAGGPEEEPTERNVRDRYLVGVLARLPRLDHERYAEEVRQGLHEKKKSSGKGRGKKQTANEADAPSLFS